MKILEGPDGWVWQVSIYSGSLQRLVWSPDAAADECATGQFRQGFHDLDGPDSTFDKAYPDGPYTWLTPYSDTIRPGAGARPEAVRGRDRPGADVRLALGAARQPRRPRPPG
ncbi:hypothetical protein GCM10023339_61050 [Alloalcanivorax gelatiniphagus]